MPTSDIILTHGFLLDEDQGEQALMKPYPPLGILYISAYLAREGFRPEIVDPTFMTRTDLYTELRNHAGSAVGIYTTHMTRKSVVGIMCAAGEAGLTVVVGGPDAANCPDEYLAHGADVVVCGEGEATTAELLRALAAGGPRRLRGIAGTVFRDETGRVVRNEPRALLDIDSLPWPARSHVDLERYLAAWRSKHDRAGMNVVTGRGCTFNCRWCSHAVFGHSHRRRRPRLCADEIAALRDQYRPGQLWYADDVFTRDSDWVLRFADELDKRRVHIPFETISRADRLTDDTVLHRLAEMGCFRLWIGAESGSDRILRAMGRGVTAEQVRSAADRAHAVGISVGFFLMWGYPGETPADIEATIELVRRCRPDSFFTTVVYPIRGTRLHKQLADGALAPADWANASDKDIRIAGRPPAEYYEWADRWLHSATGLSAPADPVAAAEARGKVTDIYGSMGEPT